MFYYSLPGVRKAWRAKMLDGFIIEQLEKDRKRKEWKPVELPLYIPEHPPEVPQDRDPENSDDLDYSGNDDGPDRGIIIIERDGTERRVGCYDNVIYSL